MGVFDHVATDVFATYEVQLSFENKIMGGVPKNPKMIEGWLRSKMKISETQELMAFTMKAMEEQGLEVPISQEQMYKLPEEDLFSLMEDMTEQYAALKSTNGFKRDEDLGVYIEDRQIKAGIKESVNILFAGERWGKTRKGPKNFTAERVFVRGASDTHERIYLERMEPDGIEPQVGHVEDKAGKRSTLTYYEFCNKPVISFEMEVVRDEIAEREWGQIMYHMQRNGIGALRSQSYGRFDTTRFERVA